MGDWFHALVCGQEDTTTGAHVAIKQIFEGDKRIGVNLGAIKEMQVMLEIQHPNIIRVRGLRRLIEGGN